MTDIEVVLEEIRERSEEMRAQIGGLEKRISDRMQLVEDRLTMLQTQQLAQASSAGRYVPEPRGVGPTGRYLSEPRSRWRRTSLYGY